MKATDTDGRRWSAASRYRLRDAEVYREKLDDLLMQSTDEVKARKFTSLSELLRPQTAAAILLPTDKVPFSNGPSGLNRIGREVATSSSGGHMRLSMKDIIARKRDGSAPLPPGAQRWKPREVNPDVMIKSYESQLSTVMPGVVHQMPWLATQEEEKEAIDRTILSSSCSNHSPRGTPQVGSWQVATHGRGGDAPSGRRPSDDYDTTLQLHDIADNAVDVFDLPQQAIAQLDITDDDDDSPSAVLATALRAAKDAEEKKRVAMLEEQQRRAADKELLLRSRLEIERYELTQELARLRERRELLTREREMEADRKQSVEAKKRDVLLRHKVTDDLVEQELAAEWAAIRQKRDEERKALRLRQNPTGAPGGPKKFFKPKYASPWEALTATSGAEPLRPPPPPPTLPMDCDSDDMSTDKKKILSMPLELRMETLKMRCREVERWQVAVEPAARDAILSVERACWHALSALFHDGWLCETRARQCLMIDERNEWLSITRHASGQHSLLQIRQWAPEVFRDKDHLSSKAASETLPPGVGASLLRQATEVHRHNVRDTWDTIFALREQLLEVQRKKRNIRETLRGISRGFPISDVDSIPPCDVQRDELNGNAVCSIPQRISARMAEEITQQQRVEYLRTQLTQLEALELRLKSEISEKGDRVW